MITVTLVTVGVAAGATVALTASYSDDLPSRMRLDASPSRDLGTDEPADSRSPRGGQPDRDTSADSSTTVAETPSPQHSSPEEESPENTPSRETQEESSPGGGSAPATDDSSGSSPDDSGGASPDPDPSPTSAPEPTPTPGPDPGETDSPEPQPSDSGGNYPGHPHR
ncbi:hypothetical protein FHX37_4419 [Haloactinospora alba]|uniref:Uncharacterized protein n=1 Tax=Haloactinospora alba TaxID=405555 RepID=A0A543N7B6_9ACTN|nr:hypothetical protein [Haloactinospora alba]TQN27693.1 hypothetical protein FHX37_4419 [Haloactinospora alba]